MLESGVRAAPVVDSGGQADRHGQRRRPAGRRTEDYRREWWLEMLAGAAFPSSASDGAGLRRVSDVMSAPLIFVAPDTPADEIAALLHWRRIKRLPVVRDGRLVGIVSRTDLLAVVEQLDRLSRSKSQHAPGLLRFLESLAGGASLRGGVASSGATSAAARESRKSDLGRNLSQRVARVRAGGDRKRGGGGSRRARSSAARGPRDPAPPPERRLVASASRSRRSFGAARREGVSPAPLFQRSLLRRRPQDPRGGTRLGDDAAGRARRGRRTMAI